MQHDFDVYGTKGALAFSQEHFNVLNFFSTTDANPRDARLHNIATIYQTLALCDNLDAASNLFWAAS